MRSLRRLVNPIDSMPWWAFYGRLLWVVAQLLLAYALSLKATPFFYQAF